MAWIKGAAYWEDLRKKGYTSPKAIGSPELMWDLFLAYVADTDNNPATKEEQSKSSRGSVDLDTLEVSNIVKFKIQRPYSWVGFEAYLGLNDIICSNLSEYKSNRKGGYEAYSEVVARIDKIMYNQKYEGATMGHFNAVIIARDLGLAEKREIAAKIEDDIDYSKLSESALEEIAKAKKEARADEWNAKYK